MACTDLNRVVALETKTLVLVCTLALTGMLVVPDAQARLYRWVDESGAVHYTDQLPPGAVKEGHSQLNEQGLTVDEVPPEPTAEERARQAEEARKKQEEADRLEQQKRRDAAILAAYRVPDEIFMARDGKLAEVDARIRVIRDRIRYEQISLIEMSQPQKEKRGQPAPMTEEERAQKIADAKKSILAQYTDIIELELQKKGIYREYDEILDRFLVIRRLPAMDRDERSQIPQLPNLVPCESSVLCDSYWQHAKDYVQARVTSDQQEFSMPELLIALDNDDRELRSFTLARVTDARTNDVYLYLDLQCKNRLTSALVCSDQKAQGTVANFRAEITGPIKLPTP